MSNTPRFSPSPFVAFQDPNKYPQPTIFPTVHVREDFHQPPPSKKSRIWYNEIPPPNPQPNYIPMPTQNIQSAIYFKTRLCNSFKSGYCHYGSKCTYAHGLNELRNNVVQEKHKNVSETADVTMDSSSEMKHSDLFRVGASLGGNDNGFDQQMKLGKTKHCFAFQRTGHCHFGNSCRFAHGFAELRQVGVTLPKSPPQPVVVNASSFMPQPASAEGLQEEEEKDLEFLRRKLLKMKNIYADWIDEESLDTGLTEA